MCLVWGSGLLALKERLKRNRTKLLSGILQNTDQETKRLLARLESTEQRQQQMMAFLAKAVQNPAFLQELLTNQRHAQRISGPDKSACRSTPMSNIWHRWH